MIADDITAWGLVPRDRTSARVAVAMFRSGYSMNDHSLGALIRTALAVGCLEMASRPARSERGTGKQTGAETTSQHPDTDIDEASIRHRWTPPTGSGYKEARLATIIQRVLWHDAAAARDRRRRCGQRRPRSGLHRAILLAADRAVSCGLHHWLEPRPMPRHVMCAVHSRLPHRFVPRARRQIAPRVYSPQARDCTSRGPVQKAELSSTGARGCITVLCTLCDRQNECNTSAMLHALQLCLSCASQCRARLDNFARSAPDYGSAAYWDSRHRAEKDAGVHSEWYVPFSRLRELCRVTMLPVVQRECQDLGARRRGWLSCNDGAAPHTRDSNSHGSHARIGLEKYGARVLVTGCGNSALPHELVQFFNSCPRENKPIESHCERLDLAALGAEHTTAHHMVDIEVLATDISPEAMAQVSSHVTAQGGGHGEMLRARVRYAVDDACSSSVASASCVAVVDKGVLDAVECSGVDEDVRRLCSEYGRVLSYDGVLLLVTSKAAHATPRARLSLLRRAGADAFHDGELRCGWRLTHVQTFGGCRALVLRKTELKLEHLLPLVPTTASREEAAAYMLSVPGAELCHASSRVGAGVERAAQLVRTYGVVCITGAVGVTAGYSDEKDGASAAERAGAALLQRCRHAVLEQQLRAVRSRMAKLGLDETLPFRFAECCRRGPRRIDIRGGTHLQRLLLDSTVSLAKHPGWWPIVRSVLGPSAKLLHIGAVISESGAPAQAWHADGEHLSHEQLDAHCINVFVPLVNLDGMVDPATGVHCGRDVLGATQFLPRTHIRAEAARYLPRLRGCDNGVTRHADGCGQDANVSCARLEDESVRFFPRAGGAIVFDHRILHRGGANRSGDSDVRVRGPAHRCPANDQLAVRPLLYLTYAKPGFEDTRNFPSASLFSAEHGPGSGCCCDTCKLQFAVTAVQRQEQAARRRQYQESNEAKMDEDTARALASRLWRGARVLADSTIIRETNGYFCSVCSLTLQTVKQAHEHGTSRKHRRRLRAQQGGLISHTFDATLRGAGVLRILALGDCHGGRALSLFSTLVRSRFFGGSAFSWSFGIRFLPPLQEVLGRDSRLLRSHDPAPTRAPNVPAFGTLVVVFSYGEIDVRMHSAKWSSVCSDSDFGDKCSCERGDDNASQVGASTHVGGGTSPMSLARAYVTRVYEYLGNFLSLDGNEGLRVLPILLAIPPPSNSGHNAKAPFVGQLADRVRATDRLNCALETVCEAKGKLATENLMLDGFGGRLLSASFTGRGTWAFAQERDSVGTDAPGSLRREVSDGHVHVQSSLCGPVHERVRSVITQRLGLAR